MDITLKPDQKKWLDDKVAAGEFSSVEEAVRLAVDDFIAIEDDDLAWARPLIENASRQIAQDKGIRLEDAIAGWRSHASKTRGHG